MEISARILREVEFRDRLRGYDTDEVDEFLERCALGVEELEQQLRQANERAERSERSVAELPPSDDDAIRRTLVLAQRTADMAVKEAEAEAAQLLEDARARADAMLSEARDEAAHTRSDAEEDLRQRVERLSAEENRLQREVATLVGLVDAERARITEALQALLGHVSGLHPSEQAEEVAVEAPLRAPEPAPEPERASSGSLADVLFSEAAEDEVDELDDDLDLSFGLSEIERQVAEDAAEAGPAASVRTGEQQLGELDPDEELWDRWARSGENDVAADDEALRGRRNNQDNWPA